MRCTLSCAVMMQTHATLTRRFEPISLSSIFHSFLSSRRRYPNSMISPVSQKKYFVLFYVFFSTFIYLFIVYSFCCLFIFPVDPSPQRVRHASAVLDDSDPENSTINSSVAMAIAGSPLPYTKVSPFVLSSLVSHKPVCKLSVLWDIHSCFGAVLISSPPEY